MKYITIKKLAIQVKVDDDDYERLKDYNYFLGKRGYVVRNHKKGNYWTRASLHRDVMNPPDGVDVDHIDQNKFNNQKSNLRLATRSQNMANVRKAKSDTSHSKYKGVSRLNRKNLKNQWLAYIRKDYKMIYLGYHATQEDAARAYNAKAIELYGEFASLNEIPDDTDILTT